MLNGLFCFGFICICFNWTANLLILLKVISLCCCKCKRSVSYVDCYWSRLAILYIDMFVRCNRYPCVLLRFVAGSAKRVAVLGFALTVQLFSCHFHDPLRSICLPPLISCCVLPSSCPLQSLSLSTGIYWPSNLCLWHCAHSSHVWDSVLLSAKWMKLVIKLLRLIFYTHTISN